MPDVPLDVEQECRPYFPSLQDGFIFADNAGGTQCLNDVADRIYDYLISSSAQTGAQYPSSVRASNRTFGEPQESAATLFNARSTDEISFGSSCTMLIENLARAMEADCQPGEELLISFSDHEANVGPWVRLAERRGLQLVKWNAKLVSQDNPFNVVLDPGDLKDLITDKTRLVAFAACSNILGGIVDAKQVVGLIRKLAAEKGARKTEICLDCVAYAPHRRVDVQDLDVDYTMIAYYKAFGPHNAALYHRESARDGSLTQVAHFFLDTLKVQPNGPGYELTWGTTGILPYFLRLGSIETGEEASDSEKLDRCFRRIAANDERLMKPLIEYLVSKRHKGVRIVGPESWKKEERVPTISFVVVQENGMTKRLLSKDIVARFNELGDVGVRNGHSYSFRLISSLGFVPEDGVVRISLVHYNTLKEVERIIEILEGVL